jgi:uracil-DNA glycosylase
VPSKLPDSWETALGEELDKPYFEQLTDFVAAERSEHRIFPPEDQVFAALEATPFDKVKVLVLGQDPYHGAGQGHGLCFSVRPGVRTPPSLRNIFKELRDEFGYPVPDNGYLMPWAEQGVLLLNAVLTVRAGAAASHAGKGWEAFTDATIRALDARSERVVFLLWGGYARKKAALITNPAHVVLEAGHPSPLNTKGFRGARPFSAANKALADAGRPVIDWDPRR